MKTVVDKMRINQYLARCGLGARRKCEQLVLRKKVTINDKIVDDLATYVDLNNDVVKVNKEIVKITKDFIYLMLNKPCGYICTKSDDKGRKTIFDLISKKYINKGLFNVGRLDYNTEGLILLTNDGDLTNILLHPSFNVVKKYIVEIGGMVQKNDIASIEKGIFIDGYKTRECKIKVISYFPDELGKMTTRLEVQMKEGLNREIRKMFAKINRNVKFLKRISLGRLGLDGLKLGKCRLLTVDEIKYLLSLKIEDEDEDEFIKKY